MRLQLSTPTASHTNLGRLRINFKSAGTYRLDNVVLEKGTLILGMLEMEQMAVAQVMEVERKHHPFKILKMLFN